MSIYATNIDWEYFRDNISDELYNRIMNLDADVSVTEVETPHGRLISEDEIMARIRQELEGLHFPIEHPDTLEGIFDWIIGKTSTVIEEEV